jgi:hypothetical protein
MATTTAQVAQPGSSRYSVNWIVNKKADLLFFIGGALTGYIMLYLHAGLGLNMLMVWFLWVVFIDTPHFYSTYLRTYFDKEEFRARKKLLLGSLLWLVVGPVLVGVSYIFYRSGVTSYMLPFILYIIFFNLWAYWHVVRQHYGILSLYKRKNNDFDARGTQIDKVLLYGGLIAPFLSFAVRHPEARQLFGLSPEFPAYPVAAMFSSEFFSQLHWEHVLVFLSVAFLIAIILGFLAIQFQRWKADLPLNVPKILFFIALIPLYAFINYSPYAVTAPLIAFAAFVTIYHDVQYHAIVWFYSRNRYHKPGVDRKKYGLAVFLSSNFVIYAVAGIAMAALLRVTGSIFDIFPGLDPMVKTSQITLFGDMTMSLFIFSVVVGIPIHHYFVDQYIWRPSKDKELQKDLKMQEQN